MQTQVQTKPKTFDFSQKSPISTTTVSQNASTSSQHASAGNGPIKSFRSGALQVAIWENETLGDDGQIRSYRSMTFDRRYKDKDGEWKSSNNLRVNDLPKAGLILAKAYEYLILTGEEKEEEYATTAS